MLVSQQALAADRTVGIYNLPDLLAAISRTYDDNSEHHYGELMES